MTIFRFKVLKRIAPIGTTTLSLVVAACGAAPPPDPDQGIIDDAKGVVLLRLKDPNSAEFAFVFLNKLGKVCGSVNARNSFGGYTGHRAFWYDPATEEAFVHNPNQDWGGKGIDAELFAAKGCSIGSEQQKALEVRKALDDSNRRLGLE